MKIFISYRRAEDIKSYIAGNIHERLDGIFEPGSVFFDKEEIGGGDDWKLTLENALNTCKVMLVIIGPEWVNLKNPNGENRLFDPNDVTRWEVETGLRRSIEDGITVIPVLVMGAEIPRSDQLPESLRQLLSKQVVNLRNYPDFSKDFDRLIHDIKRSRGFAEGDISNKKFEPETIYIAEGSFLMGSPPGDGIPTYESPQIEVYLPAYWIGVSPVTNTQFEEFIHKTDRSAHPALGWDGQSVPDGLGEHPVTGVTWYEAFEYGNWLSKETGRSYSLPNEAQWEKACRGGNNYLYPWGNEFDPKRCNLGADQLARVKAFSAQNDFGCFDLVGNVRQWTGTLWGEKRVAPDQKFSGPWKDDQRNDKTGNSQIWRVVRGSSYLDSADLMRASARDRQLPGERGFPGKRYGFRVVRNV